MDFNYFDMIGCDDSLLFQLLGIILFPILFPLYLVLKARVILIDFLTSVFSKKEKNNVENEHDNIEIDETRKEQLEREITRLKEQKRIVEEKIRSRENELINISIEETKEELSSETGLSLNLRKK